METKGISGLAVNLLDILHFWKNWPFEAQLLLLLGVIFAFLAWIVLTYGMRIHGLDWHDAQD